MVTVDSGASWIFSSMQAATDTINLGAAQAEFSGAVPTGHTVAFTTGGATAKIDNVAQFAGTVTGFQRGDALDFPGLPFTSVSYSPGTLTLKNNGIGFAQISLSTPITSPVFSVTADGSGGTIIHLQPPPPPIDFNGDGASDLLFQNSNGMPAIWEMNGTTPIFATALPNPGSSWHVIGTGDFNGDGKADILFQNSDGTPAVWEMNGTTPIIQVALPNPGPSWHVIGTGDFNGDNRADILFQNNDGTPAIWLMNGTIVTNQVALPNPGPSWHVIAAGDVSGDGRADILFQNTDGTPAIWEMNGTIVTNQFALPNPGPSWHIVGTGDFNGDGMSDLLFQNTDE
jgi:hypothetical protein